MTELQNMQIAISLLFGTSIFFTLLFIVRIVENIISYAEHNMILVMYGASISWGVFFYQILYS